MRLIILSVFAFSFSAQASIFLPSCYNYTPSNEAVGFSYQSCVNGNFDRIKFELGTGQYFQYCSNFGSHVSHSYISCVQNNFTRVENSLRDRNLFLSRCFNFRSDTLDFSFTNCVNSNWRKVEDAFRR